jgi:glycosyltransferase involved in cell wall biosynthesis
VAVVDDGSMDDSREVIASFGDRIVAVFEENGGEASVINSGVGCSRGEYILLLDSDDVLHADATATALAAFRPVYSRVAAVIVSQVGV